MLAEADVVPTSTMQIPEQEPVIPIQDLINDALQHRAELAESRIDLNSRDISNKAVRNALLPDARCLSPTTADRAWAEISHFRPAPAPRIGTCYTSVPPPFQNTNSVGYGGTLNQLVNSHRSRQGRSGSRSPFHCATGEAQANQVRAQLEYRQAQVRLHQLENQVRIEVRNAQFDVRQNRAAVQAAQSAVDLARQTLDADQQKLKVGLTTQTAILQDAATLTTGESNLVSAKAAYEKSRIELDRATGLLLDHAGHRRRRCNPRPGHAPAYCSVRCASPGAAADRTTVVLAGSFGAARRTNVAFMGGWACRSRCCKHNT